MSVQAHMATDQRRPPVVSDFENVPATLLLTNAPLTDHQRKNINSTIRRVVQTIRSKDITGWKESSSFEVQSHFWKAARGLAASGTTLASITLPLSVAQTIIPVATRSLTIIPLCGDIKVASELEPIPDPTFEGNDYVFYDLASVAPGDGLFRHAVITKSHEKIFKTTMWRFAPTGEDPYRWITRTETRRKNFKTMKRRSG